MATYFLQYVYVEFTGSACLGAAGRAVTYSPGGVCTQFKLGLPGGRLPTCPLRTSGDDQQACRCDNKQDANGGPRWPTKRLSSQFNKKKHLKFMSLSLGMLNKTLQRTPKKQPGYSGLMAFVYRGGFKSCKLGMSSLVDVEHYWCSLIVISEFILCSQS